MSEIKLRRLTELNARLKDDLDRPRVRVSEACLTYDVSEIAQAYLCSLIEYTRVTEDHMVPSVWGNVDKKDDPYLAQQQSTKSGCCTVM